MEALLPDLSALSLDDAVPTGMPKEAKPKKAKLTPYDKAKAEQEYVLIVIKDLDSDDEPEQTVTVGGEELPLHDKPFKLSEAERTWLRTTYGNNWSKAKPEVRKRLGVQARRALSQLFKPQVEQALEELRELESLDFWGDHLNDNGDVKLDWATEVRPALVAKFPPNWLQGPDGAMLTEAEKKVRSDQVKAELRATKGATLKAQLDARLLTKEKALVKALVEELNYPKNQVKRRATALCRHWFNRKGTDGKMRVWHAHKEGVDVSEEMQEKRYKWAMEVVSQPTYDPANPPQPGDDLYLPLDVKPVAASYLPDGVATISKQGGQWLWLYMRALEAAKFEDLPDLSSKYAIASVETSARYWEPAFRTEQKKRLEAAYKDFIDSVNEMSGVPDAKNVAYSYTAGSGKFNKYLLYPSSKVNGDPAQIPDQGAGLGGVAGNMDQGQIGPPDMLHRLYKLINRCPRLPEPAVFLRSVRDEKYLPHNLGKPQVTAPVVGRAYLNATFMSTSSAQPSDYLSGVLGGFYNKGTRCCMYAITAPAGSPVLPLVLGGASSSAYAAEQEVLFPPGLILVYQGEKMLPVDATAPSKIHFYQAFAPPPIALPAAPAA